MTNDELRDSATARAEALANEIREKAVAAGCDASVFVRGYAHSVGSGWAGRRYDGHIEIQFEALYGGSTRRRSLNDCKRPIDVVKIVALLVEHATHIRRQNEQLKAEMKDTAANELVASEMRELAPTLQIRAHAAGIDIAARSLSPERARAIVAALKGLA